jgi:type II secretory pathway component PulL
VASRILAVHVTGGVVSAAVAASTLRTLEITALGDLPLLGAEATGEKRAARSWDRVVASVPADSAFFRLLELPFHDRRRLAQAVGPALEEYVPLSLDEAITSFDSASTERRGPVLAVMIARAKLDAHLARLAELGVEPDRLIWAPCATLEVYRRAAGGGTPAAAIDVGDDGAVVGWFDETKLGGLRVVAPADPDTLVRNAAWSLRTLDPPSTRVLVGGAAAEALMPALADALTGFELEPLPETCPVDLTDDLSVDWRAAATAIGLVLAARGDLEPPLVEIGIGEEAEHALPSDVRQALRRTVPWALATVVLLLGAVTLDHVRLERRYAALEQRALALYRTAIPSGPAGPGLRLKMEMRATELERRRAEVAGSVGETNPLAVLAEMSETVPRDVAVEFDVFTFDPPHLRLRGHSANFESVTKLQELLRARDSFASVEVSDVHAAVSGEGVDFEMTIKLAGSQPT